MTSVQEIVLKLQLYKEAVGLCSELSNEQRKEENSVELIIDAVYQRIFCFVTSEVYEGFHRLLSTRRNNNESLKFFEIISLPQLQNLILCQRLLSYHSASLHS